MKRVLLFIAILAACRSQQNFENVADDLEVIESTARIVGRIVNGKAAAANQFPHQALIFINTLQGNYQCGGSLISPFWVLSAAHCIIGARSAKVLLGSVNRTSMPIQRNAVQINRLATYNPVTVKDDISLIKVDVAVPITDNARPIQLPSRSQAGETYLNYVLLVSGFGLTTANQVSNTLQYTNVIGISNADCKNIYGPMIISSMLCTLGYPNRNQGSCQGDSGGGLVTMFTNSTFVGIVSFGAAQSCTAGYPQGFTRVGPYLSWINTVTGIALRN